MSYRFNDTAKSIEEFFREFQLPAEVLIVRIAHDQDILDCIQVKSYKKCHVIAANAACFVQKGDTAIIDLEYYQQIAPMIFSVRQDDIFAYSKVAKKEEEDGDEPG